MSAGTSRAWSRSASVMARQPRVREHRQLQRLNPFSYFASINEDVRTLTTARGAERATPSGRWRGGCALVPVPSMGNEHGRWSASAEQPRERRADEVPEPQRHVLLALQRAAGNRAVARMLSGASRRTIRRGVRRPPRTGGRRAVERPDGAQDAAQGHRRREAVLQEQPLHGDGLGADRGHDFPGRPEKYVKAGPKTIKVPKKAPRTVADWRKVAYLSGSTMLYPAQRYPHVTIDLAKEPGEESDVVEFTEMHYSRSFDDPYRSGYRLASAGWECSSPTTRRTSSRSATTRSTSSSRRSGYLSVSCVSRS